MSVDAAQYQAITAELGERVTLVAVSKTQPAAAIRELYDLGQRDFGENYVQELVDKQAQLPGDIRWHFIGHLQSNKVKYIAPFVHLIHGTDSVKLLKEIDKQAGKAGRSIDCLLQVHIAQEETKFGFDAAALEQAFAEGQTADLVNSRVLGLMGMASLSDEERKVAAEFEGLKQLADRFFPGGVLSMGMSGDYKIAVAAGSNMVRIGSLLFGKRS